MLKTMTILDSIQAALIRRPGGVPGRCGPQRGPVPVACSQGDVRRPAAGDDGGPRSAFTRCCCTRGAGAWIHALVHGRAGRRVGRWRRGRAEPAGPRTGASVTSIRVAWRPWRASRGMLVHRSRDHHFRFILFKVGGTRELVVNAIDKPPGKRIRGVSKIDQHFSSC